MPKIPPTFQNLWAIEEKKIHYFVKNRDKNEGKSRENL